MRATATAPELVHGTFDFDLLTWRVEGRLEAHHGWQVVALMNMRVGGRTLSSLCECCEIEDPSLEGP